MRETFFSYPIAKYYFFLFFILNAPTVLKAQDPQFGHFYNNAMLYNPAFAGNVDLGRFALSYRNQWPGIPGRFVSLAASYEFFFNKIKSGMGVQFVNDRAGSGGLSTNGFNYLYSYQISLSRNLSILAGLKAGLYGRRVDFSKLTFADQIARDNAPASMVNNFRDKVNYANFGSGVVFYHQKKYWFGLSFDHLNTPNNSFEGTDAQLDLLTAMQGGWNFDVNKNLNGNGRATLTAAFLYKAQQRWDQLDLGVYYKTAPLLFGVWHRGLPLLKSNEGSGPNVDALMLLFGLKYESISFAYSYDATTSRLSGSTNGSHEISIVIEYPKAKRRRPRYFTAPCPKF